MEPRCRTAPAPATTLGETDLHGDRRTPGRDRPRPSDVLVQPVVGGYTRFLPELANGVNEMGHIERHTSHSAWLSGAGTTA